VTRRQLLQLLAVAPALGATRVLAGPRPPVRLPIPSPLLRLGLQGLDQGDYLYRVRDARSKTVILTATFGRGWSTCWSSHEGALWHPELSLEVVDARGRSALDRTQASAVVRHQGEAWVWTWDPKKLAVNFLPMYAPSLR
jgi:hypothetical protein